MKRKENLEGQIFNYLFVKEYIGNSRYLCECLNCGRETIASSTRLKNGRKKSCGCLKERLISKAATTHGDSYSRLYREFYSMHIRCYYNSDETNNAIFTYDATAKTLLSKSGKYIGRTANSNGLDASTTSLTNNISFVGTDEAVIASPKGPALQFNKTSGQTRFRYFTGTQTAVQLYKKMAATSYDITIGSTGYKTLISAVSATLPVGVTAYKAISAGEGKVKLTSVASIKAGSAYVLKGTPSANYTLTVTDTPEEPTGNILEISDENTSNGVYVLANGSSGAGFYKWMGGSLGAGRVIVPASAVSGAAREYMEFSFDDDATAIEAVKAQSVENSEFFDLQGRCVAQPTKGLYIVNGKKVIVK